LGYRSITSFIWGAGHWLSGNRRTRAHAVGSTRVAVLFLVMGIGAATASAMPLAEYGARANRAAKELASAVEIVRREGQPSDWDRVTRVLNSLYDTLPREDTIEWDGARVRVNNEWIEGELKTLQALPFGDSKRVEILDRIIERLRALEERLTEVDQNSSTVSASSKDDDKARLEAISRREEFKPNPPQENIFQRAWRRFKEWVNGLFPGSGGLQPGTMSWLSFIAMTVILGVAAAVLGYAISKLIPFFQRRLGKRKPERREARIVLGERLEPDQSAADLLSEAEALARRGDVRAAIRKAYIALLCELGDRKVLTLAQHKTNRDYLRAVREKRPLLDEMQKLTSSFENHWYGLRQTTSDDWTTFRAGYEKVLSS